MSFAASAARNLTVTFATSAALALGGCTLKEEKELLCVQKDGAVLSHTFKGEVALVTVNKQSGDAQITSSLADIKINGSLDDYKISARDEANGEMTELKNPANCAIATTTWRLANF
ncbi:MAG: hypothetical protein PW788_03320 [Micavibrio sp.]|nr:hypothetical protein [Micavibrio sp.]